MNLKQYAETMTPEFFDSLMLEVGCEVFLRLSKIYEDTGEQKLADALYLAAERTFDTRADFAGDAADANEGRFDPDGESALFGMYDILCRESRNVVDNIMKEW